MGVTWPACTIVDLLHTLRRLPLLSERDIAKHCKPISRILFLLSFIWDEHYCSPLSAYPPSASHELGRAALWRWYIWHFSPQGLPESIVPNTSCGPLPHIFNLTPHVCTSRAVIFCGTFSLRHGAGSPAVSGMRRSTLSGLSYPT